jgi:hypothetical protein
LTPCKYEDITAWDYNNLRIAKLFSWIFILGQTLVIFVAL